ncbi:MAG TPA: hypothetical protein VIM30_03295 [Candidatus Limnocylindrales bacterium]
MDTAGGVRGIALHIAARVAALTDADEVFVSGTVLDLVAGSGLDLSIAASMSSRASKAHVRSSRSVERSDHKLAR